MYFTMYITQPLTFSHLLGQAASLIFSLAETKQIKADPSNEVSVLSAEIRGSGQGRRRWSSPTNVTCFFSPKSKPSWALGLRKGHQIPGLGRELWSPFYHRMLWCRNSGWDYRLQPLQDRSRHCAGSQVMAEHVISPSSRIPTNAGGCAPFQFHLISCWRFRAH